MKLKTATLLAIIGQSVAFIVNLCVNFLQLYQGIFQTFGTPGGRVILAIPSFLGVGSLVLFLIILYSRQE